MADLLSYCFSSETLPTKARKHRKSLLDDDAAKNMKKTTQVIAERYLIEMEAIGFDRDDIRPLCGAYPIIASGKVVSIFIQ